MSNLFPKSSNRLPLQIIVYLFVLAGTATVEELRLLNQICKDQHDRQCLKVVKNALAGKH